MSTLNPFETVDDIEDEVIDEIEFKIHGISNLRLGEGPSQPVFLSYGIGCTWYKTDFVQTANPTWQESKKFKVRSPLVPFRVLLCHSLPNGKHEVVGRLKINLENCQNAPISELDNDMHVTPFIDNKTNHIPGYLIFECYIIGYRSKNRTRVIGWFKNQIARIPDYLLYSLWPARWKICKMCSCKGSENDEMSSSMENLANRHHTTFRIADTLNLSSSIATTLGRSRSFSALSDIDENQEYNKKTARINSKRRMSRSAKTFPLVRDVEPKEGSVFGGERLTITGQNLGLDAQDITGLYVCGSNCLSTLEYESDRIIYCTTKAWRAITGQVTLITASGGRSQGNVKYRFIGKRSSTVSPYNQSVKRKVSSQCGGFRDSGLGLNGVMPAFDESYDRGYFRLLKTVDEACQTDDYLKPTESQDRSRAKSSIRRSSLPSPRNESITTLEGEIIKMKIRNAQLQIYVDDLLSKVHEKVDDVSFLDEIGPPPTEGTL